MEEKELKNKIQIYKYIAKTSFMCIVCSIFIVPFGYFSIALLIGYLNDESINNLSSFALLVAITIIDTIFYVSFEIFLFLKIFKNKSLLTKEFIWLASLNFFFTFITNTWMLVLVFKDLLNTSEFNQSKTNMIEKIKKKMKKSETK